MTIAMLLEMTTSFAPDRVAVRCRGDEWTYADLVSASQSGAALVQSERAGSLAFLGTNSSAVPISLFAAAYAGVPFAALNYRLAADQLHELLAQLDSPLVVADSEYLTGPALSGHRCLSTDEWLSRSRARKLGEASVVSDDAPAVILFTSGTTATPKGVLLQHSNLLQYVMQTVEFAGADDADAALVCVPPYHIAGVGTVLSNVFAGRRLVYLSEFRADEWLRLVDDEQVTQAMVVPTMLSRIVDHLDGIHAELPSLRSIAYGGSRMPPVLIERALAALPTVDFVNAYGLTETSSTIAVLGPEDHRAACESPDITVRRRLGSVGKPVPGIELVIRDEAGGPCAPEAVGELWVRGAQVSGDYLGLGSVLDAEGWFPTHDRAWLDTEGYLFVEGRADDTIIRGGENIAPAEIEDVIALHPDVEDVAVFGVPDDEWGQLIVAIVVLREPGSLGADQVKEWVRVRLRGSRTPDRVAFRSILPYTATGKLLRRQLVSEISEELPA